MGYKVEKICVICKTGEVKPPKKFLCENPECELAYYANYNDGVSNCIICNKELSLKQLKYKNKACSRVCAIEVSKITCLEKYGVEHTLQSKNCLEKKNKTCEKLYGTKNTASVPEIKKKFLETNMKRHGRYYGNQAHLKNYDKYTREYILENFTTDGVVTLKDREKIFYFYGFIKPQNVLRKLKEWDIPHEKANNYSFAEKIFLKKLIQDYPHFEYEENNRRLIRNPKSGCPFEIDIIVKLEGKIVCGIEYNGNEWHDKDNQTKEKLKSELCENIGITLHHIWEDSLEEDYEKLKLFLDKFKSNERLD